MLGFVQVAQNRGKRTNETQFLIKSSYYELLEFEIHFTIRIEISLAADEGWGCDDRTKSQISSLEKDFQRSIVDWQRMRRCLLFVLVLLLVYDGYGEAVLSEFSQNEAECWNGIFLFVLGE